MNGQNFDNCAYGQGMFDYGGEGCPKRIVDNRKVKRQENKKIKYH